MLWNYLRVLVILFFGLISFNDPVMANNVLEAQKMLTKLGYAPGAIDGAYGGKTKRALDEYYKDKNKKFDGKLDKNEIVDLTTSIKLIKTSQQKFKKSRHIQHARYSKHIATPFRDLKVSADFRLIDDFDSFMDIHKSELEGKLIDSKGFFNFRRNQGIDFNFCLDDLVSTTSKKANPSVGVQNVTINCAQMISQRFLNNAEIGIKNYQKIILGWLDNGIVHNPNKFGEKLPQKMMNEWPYAISSNVPQILTHYALYHKLYGFSSSIHQNIIQMGESFYTQWDYYPLRIRQGSFMQKLCNLKSQYKVVVESNDHCGSYNARMATGGIYFGLEFNSQLAFDTGIRHLEIMLATFNKDAVYAAQAHRGICAVGYMKQFPPHFELVHYAFQKAYGIDFINTKNINGVTPAEAYLKLWKIAHDPLETVVKYWNGFDQMNCSNNGKNQAAMVAQLKKDPSSYQDIWNGFNYADFLLSSPVLARQKLPKEWESLFNSSSEKGNDIFQTVAGGDWLGINPYLLQLALDNVGKQRRNKRQKIQQKKELLLSYDGNYKAYLSLSWNGLQNMLYQDLGPIEISINQGHLEFDKKNILYDALRLEDLNFSLNHEGKLEIKGYIRDKIKDNQRQCVYLAGDLNYENIFHFKADKKCEIKNQRLRVKFIKNSSSDGKNIISSNKDSTLDGKYNVQWTIKGVNSEEIFVEAKDELILKNGVGVFSGLDTEMQPSFNLRQNLRVQYNINGEIIILGDLDLFEKNYIKQFYATGKILPKKETTITSVWGMGDIFTLKIEKNNTKKIKKVKEMQAKVLIYGDDFIFDKKNNSFQLKRLDEIIKINQNDFSLNFDSSDEKFFDGDISYTTSANNFGTTWIGLKVKKTDEVSHNIKIAFQIEEGSFPNFPEAFSISKNECGVFKDMVDDSFIIPLKTDDLFELELFDCHVKVLQENLNDDDFGILKNRINTAISLVDTIEITNKYF